jgi:hypothetical protein
MNRKPIIIILLIFTASIFVATYLVGIATSWALIDPNNLYCWCWDLCLLPFYQRFILIIIECVGFILIYKNFSNWSSQKIFYIAIISAFILEYFVFHLDILGRFIYDGYFEFLNLTLPIHLFIGRILVICILTVLSLIIFKKRLT